MSNSATTATCRDVRRLLAGGGAAALDEPAQEHVAGCEPCFQLLEATSLLDEGLHELPRHDAPEAAVAALLARPELRVPPRRSRLLPALSRGRDLAHRATSWLLGAEPRWAAIAAPAAILVMLGLVVSVRSTSPAGARRQGADTFELGRRHPVPNPPRLSYASPSPVPTATAAPTPVATDGAEVRDELRSLGYLAPPATPPVGIPAERPPVYIPPDHPPAYIPADGPPVYVPPPQDGVVQKSLKAGGKEQENGVRSEDSMYQFDGGGIDVRPLGDAQLVETRESSALNDELSDDNLVTGRASQGLLVLATPGVKQKAAAPDSALQDAAAFLAERDVVDGVAFVPAEGYWANTYLPGDRALRELQARLAGARIAIHEGARQVAQPFDAPQDGAIGIVLQADRRAVAGRSRVLLQVGLAGSERHAGRRSAMSLAVVLDLGEAPGAPEAATMRALLEALAAAREAGDRFSLVVAGAGSAGLVVEPDDFRSGPLVVKLEELLEAGGGGGDLRAALGAAIEQACTGDDPAAPLGSTAVLLVTSRPLGGTGALEGLAHAASVNGVPLSVVGIGTGVDVAELDRLVLAGQGRRRLVLAPADAARTVEHELAAVGRAVARAVRLSIRLSPGVALAGVVGSERLDLAASARVKEMEQSIDERLARTLGIQADRGLDEEGVQVVIPTFYAGDRHVILLDLVVPGPGDVAEVTARYKDLVHLRNGSSHAALALPRGEEARGALQANVLLNLLAHRLGLALEAAGSRLGRGDVAGARESLVRWRGLLDGLGAHVPALEGSAEVAADARLLDGYLAALGTPPGGQETIPLPEIASSLRYAGRLKVLPRPQSDPATAPEPARDREGRP